MKKNLIIIFLTFFLTNNLIAANFICTNLESGFREAFVVEKKVIKRLSEIGKKGSSKFQLSQEFKRKKSKELEFRGILKQKGSTKAKHLISIDSRGGNAQIDSTYYMSAGVSDLKVLESYNCERLK